MADIVTGKPPFGDRNNLARSFYKKATEICDAIAFILPIRQLNNTDKHFIVTGKQIGRAHV